MEVLLSRVIFKSQLSEPHELGRTGGAAAFHRSWHERHPGPVEHAARLRCLLLGAHPSHPTGDRPPSCGGALPRRECGHAQRVVPGGLVRRGAAGPPARDQARSAANGASASSATDVPARPLRAPVRRAQTARGPARCLPDAERGPVRDGQPTAPAFTTTSSFPACSIAAWIAASHAWG